MQTIDSTQVAHRQYICSTQAVHRQYTGSTQSVHRLYKGSTQAVHMQYICSTQAVHMQYTGSTQTVHMPYTGSTYAVHRQYIDTQLIDLDIDKNRYLVKGSFTIEYNRQYIGSTYVHMYTHVHTVHMQSIRTYTGYLRGKRRRQVKVN